MKLVRPVLMICALLGTFVFAASVLPAAVRATPHAPAAAPAVLPAALPPDSIRRFERESSLGGSIATVAISTISDTLVGVGQGSALALLRHEPDDTFSALGRLVLDDLVQDVALSGTLAYVAAGESGLVVADISDPAAPQAYGSVRLSGAVLSVQVADGRAYAATAGLGGGLHVLDVRDPAQPALLGSLPLSGGSPSGVRVVGNIAYLTVGFGGLRVVDVSNPAAPLLLAELDTPGQARGLAAFGSYVYIAAGNEGLLSIDVSDPTNPTERGSANLTGEARAVYADGEVAAVATNAGLWLLDISNPARPRVRAPALTEQPTFDAVVTNTIAYAAAGGAGLLLLDSADPDNVSLLASFATLADTRDVWADAARAYVAAGPYGLHIVDVSNPMTPTVLGQIGTREPALTLQVRDDLVYVATGRGGIEVFDVSTPQTPTLHTQIPVMGGSAIGLHIEGSSAWVALGNSGFQQLDISAAQVVSPTQAITPTLITSSDTPGSALGLTVISDTVYIADRGGIFAFRPPESSGTYTVGMSAYVRDIQVVGNLAVAADSGFPSGLYLLDVSSPITPTLHDFAPVAAPGSALAVQPAEAGGVAYVAAGSSGVHLFDTSVPTRTVQRSSYDTPGLARELYAADDLIYVADADGGLLILRTSDVPARRLFLPIVQR